MQISQKDFSTSTVHNQLLEEVLRLAKTSNLKEVIITGGEPFLYLRLAELVQRLNEHGVLIRIFSGLGINEKRFEKEIKKIKDFNVEIVISNENFGDTYEFIRYGNTWEQLNKNISIIEKYNINYGFFSVVSNLTIMNIHDFIKWVGNRKIIFQPCQDPGFLSISTLDYETKQTILSRLDCYPDHLRQLIKNDLTVDALELERQQLKTYLTEFAQRRDLSLLIFPESFQKWIADV